MGASRSDGWLHSVMAGTCRPVPPRFLVGDEVDVLNSFRLPKVEEVKHTGVIQRIEEREGQPTLYWVSGLAVARTLTVLRLVRRGARIGFGEDNHLSANPRKTLSEVWAEEDDERRGEE